MDSPSGERVVRARRCQLQRRGGSFPCGTSATEAGAQGQDRAFPEQDRSRPRSLAMGVGPWMQEPSDPGGKRIAFVFVDLLRFLCSWFNYVLICICTCCRLYRSRHSSDSSGTSSNGFL